VNIAWYLIQGTYCFNDININFMKSQFMKNIIFLSFLLFSFATEAQHTFSIVAVDPLTGEIGSAGATCGDSIMWAGTPGAKLISSVMPGKFAIHTQAYHIPQNQANADAQMNGGASPQQAIDWLKANDAGGDSSIRQYGIVDYNGGSPRSAAFTGHNCMDYKNHITGPNYSIQGNILLGPQILDSIESKFLNTPGSLANRLMAALQGAKVNGADQRCTTYHTSSLSAFIRVAKPTDAANNLWLDLNVGATPYVSGNPGGAEPIDLLQQKLNTFLSVEEKRLNNYNYRLYPNPASGYAYFEFMTGYMPEQITITDAAGRVVKLYGKSDITIKTPVDLASMQAGMYFVKFYKTGSAVHLDKLVVR
jgi:uncharacterized Ntn-hydrolase superfamily protein